MLVIGTLTIAACDGTASTTPPSHAATVTPTISVTPTPTVADVPALFLEQMRSIESGVVEFEAISKVLGVTYTISGRTAFDGLDSAAEITSKVFSTVATFAVVHVSDETWVKTGTGPWLPGPPASSSGLPAFAKVGDVELTDIGLRDWKGHQVHQLVAEGALFDPTWIGLQAPGVVGGNATISYFARADGTPIGVNTVANWTQEVDGTRVPAHIDLSVRFMDLGEPQAIKAPADAWMLLRSDRYGYSLFHPGDYATEEGEFWDYFGDADGMPVAGVGRDRTAGASLASLGRSEVALLKEEFDTRSVTNEKATIAGVDARLLTLEGTSEDGEVYVQELVFVRGRFVYFFFLISPTGNKADDTTQFEHLASTFLFE